MELNAAKSLVEKVFSSSYSRENFKKLAVEIFNGYDRNERPIHQEIFHVQNFTNLGLYEDDKGKKIAVFEVELLKDKSLHRTPRVGQRNLIASQLKRYGYDSALISFYHANHDEWRLSFVTLEYSIDFSSEKEDIVEHLSPARRQSFVAGPNEGSHTAKKQCLTRLQSDAKPSFNEIASIFGLEAVSDDFYEQYKELYLRLTEELEGFIVKDKVIAEDFKEKEVSASDFAKKTLGQFVFLYFIQRKGWIKDKANPDDRFSFSKLFDNRERYGVNFFNDLMEPIFYEALAKKDPNLDVYSVLKHYEFPYLNGGLFEPIQGYDWEKTNIVITDAFFKNENKTKDGDIGDGLLDVFNRFNFTVHENDSLDQDIAVDPEMLGKVFENLLDVKDRKNKGAFYTPREIVQYMCQESLINYLVTEIGDEIPSEVLKLFITNHSILEAKDMKGTELEIIAENAMALDQLLANVKVCDPAVGSGAFPMGMLSEIVGARNSLQPFLSNKQTIYDLKLHTIGQSLYGVDLDPSAVDIARLRFWLSLIIEEETPTPLPNLEHKLMQGNSLLSSYEGVDLFNDQFLVNEDGRQEKLNIIDEEIKVLENELKDGFNTADIQRVRAIKKHLIRLGKQKNKIQAENTSSPTTHMLFESDDALSRIKKQVDLLQSKIKQFLLPEGNSNKEALKNDIEDIKWDLIEASVDSEIKARAFQQLKNKRVQPFFLWKLEFIDVFRNNNGFDIVIGNPPYIQLQKTINEASKTKLGDLYSASKYETFTKTGDIYALFYELGIKLAKKSGYLSLITSNKWMRAGYGASLRKFLCKYELKALIDFSGYSVFSNATVDVNILSIKKSDPSKSVLATHFKGNLKNYSIYKYIQENQVRLSDLSENSWTIKDPNHQALKDKIESMGIPLKDWDVSINNGIKTGYNSAFIIDQLKRDELVAEDPKSEEILKPILKGKDIKFYSHNSKNLYLVACHNGFKNKRGEDIKPINIDSYPVIKKHLNEHWEKIEKRGDKGFTPYNLRPCAYIEEIEETKIIYPETTQGPYFYFDKDGKYYIEKTCFMISSKNSNLLLYLYTLLRSKLITYIFRNFFTGVDLSGSGYQYNKHALEKTPIILMENADQNIKEKLIILSKKIVDLIELDAPLDEIKYYQNEIDDLIFKLYRLNEEEILIINNDRPIGVPRGAKHPLTI